VKNYIRCFDCESKIHIGDKYFTEERDDGVQVPYCEKCYGHELEEDDDFIETFWENHGDWAT